MEIAPVLFLMCSTKHMPLDKTAGMKGETVVHGLQNARNDMLDAEQDCSTLQAYYSHAMHVMS